jgi:hypothetical protein
LRRFRDLLKPDPRSTPKDDQDRASRGLAAAVAESNLRWWKNHEGDPVGGKRLLLGVAPYSQYDLTLLDLIDERLGSAQVPAVEVYVANLQDYDNVDQLSLDFPGIVEVYQTPLVAVRESGSPKRTAWGKKARDMAAEVLGIEAGELQRRIMEESPRYGKGAKQ